VVLLVKWYLLGLTAQNVSVMSNDG